MNNCFKKDVLDSAKIMVVGCGALGNEVLKNLALMGVGNLVIVDFDTVEPRNLSRSVLFSETENSIGETKVDVAAKAIRKINPAVKIKTINGDISADVGLGLIREMDIVIACVDNRWARYCINRLCMRAGIQWIDGGISELEGTIKLFEPEKNCYACALSNEDLAYMKKRFSCAGNIKKTIKATGAPTTSLIASVIGSVQVQEAFKLIHNKYSIEPHYETLSGKIFVYDGNNLLTSIVKFEAFDDDCSQHEQWEPVIKSSLSSKTTIREALLKIKTKLGVDSIGLMLINDCFVDYIYDKESDEKFMVMLPGRKVEQFITQSPELSKKPVSSYYQNEITQFQSDSPYLELTLEDIGIPEQDILKMRSGSKGSYGVKDYFIEIK